MNFDITKEESGFLKLLFAAVSAIFVPLFPIIYIYYSCIKSFAGIMQKFTILNFFLFVSLLCNSFVELYSGDGKTKKHI